MTNELATSIAPPRRASNPRAATLQAYVDLLSTTLEVSDAKEAERRAYEFGRRALGQRLSVAALNETHHRTVERWRRIGTLDERGAQRALRIYSSVLHAYDRVLSDPAGHTQRPPQSGDNPSFESQVPRVTLALTRHRDRLHAEVAAQTLVLRKRGEELTRLNAELEARRQEQSTFTYAISHDLKAPAESIQKLLNTYIENHEDAAIDLNNVRLARDAAGRLRRLLADLLVYIRAMQLEPQREPVDLGQVVTNVLSDLEAGIIATNATLDIDTLPTVRGTESQLWMLFQNLIGNAIKFKRPGEAPHISIRDHSAPGANFVEIAITDNGIGIGPESFDRIFEMFGRLHSETEYPGSGLGLALCRRVVELHNGSINVHSGVGEGATFTVTLPRSGA